MAPRWRKLRTEPLVPGSELTRVVLPSPNAKAMRVFTNQTIANNSNTPVTFNAEIIDNHDMVDIAAQPTRVTITFPGVYLFTGQFKWAASGVGTRIIHIIKNGGSAIGVCELPVGAAGAGPTQQVHAIDEMTTGDYVELFVYQLSGGNLNSDVSNPPYLAASWQT